MQKSRTRAQGAIEYLLLIGAAIAVVAVVISYMASILGLYGPALNRETLDSLCAPRQNGGLDQNTLICGCYLKDLTRGDKDQSGLITMASPLNCPEALGEKFKTNELLTWN